MKNSDNLRGGVDSHCSIRFNLIMFQFSWSLLQPITKVEFTILSLPIHKWQWSYHRELVYSLHYDCLQRNVTIISYDQS